MELRRKQRRMYAGSALIGVIAARSRSRCSRSAQGGSGRRASRSRETRSRRSIPESNQVVGQVPNVGARPGRDRLRLGVALGREPRRPDRLARRPRLATVVRSVPVGGTPTGPRDPPGAVWVVGPNAGEPVRDASGGIDPQFDTVAERTRSATSCRGRRLRRCAAGATSGSRLLGLALAPRPGDGEGHPADRPELRAYRDRARRRRHLDRGQLREHRHAHRPDRRPDPDRASGKGPSAIAVGESGVWVADTLDDAVMRIDPATRAVDDDDSGRDKHRQASPSAPAQCGSRTAATAP